MEQQRKKFHRVPPSATKLARELRRDTTPPERILWGMLRNRQLGGLKFRRQVAIGGYVVDFYCAEASLVVELDGESHSGRREYDDQRTKFLEARGLHVFRITNHDLIKHQEMVGEAILREAQPSPQPSP